MCSILAITMTKPQVPVVPTSSDVGNYFKTKTDLALELFVYKLACDLGFEAVHGGTYIDPVSQKVRQYDVRASMQRGQYCLRLAIECKALSPAAPLVVACTRRAFDDAVVDFVHAIDPTCPHLTSKSVAQRHRRVPSRPEMYATNGYVGKTIAQIEFDHKSSEWISKGDLFDKWSQALGSAADLFEEAKRASTRYMPDVYTAVIPILVIPDNTLWVAGFSDSGVAADEPQLASSMSLQVHRVFDSDPDTGFTVSHLHLIARGALENVLKCLAPPSEDRLVYRHILFGSLAQELFREQEQRERQSRLDDGQDVRLK